MSQISEQIAGLENQIKNEETVSKFGAIAEKLLTNKDFKDLILNHYFESEAARLVHLLAWPGNKEADLTEIQQSLMAISKFRAWLLNNISMGKSAKTNIKAIKEQIEMINQMDVDYE